MRHPRPGQPDCLIFRPAILLCSRPTEAAREYSSGVRRGIPKPKHVTDCTEATDHTENWLPVPTSQPRKTKGRTSVRVFACVHPAAAALNQRYSYSEFPCG